MKAWLWVTVGLVGCGGTTFDTQKGGPDGGSSDSGSGGSAAGGRNAGGSTGGIGSGARLGSGGKSSGGSAGVPTGGASGMGGSGGTSGASGMAGGGGASGAGGGAGGSPLPECPGATPIPNGVMTCRTSSDCGFGFCTENYISGGCGACFPAPHDCTVDSDCGSNNVCVPSMDGPCTCGGPGTVCAARCTSSSCAAGERCEDTTGVCVPITCGQDYACSAGEICFPNRTDADVHGCAPSKCASDGYGCPTGFVCLAGPMSDVHGCSPVDCAGGAFKCPSNTDCDPTSSAPHHCAVRSCTVDTDCDCGACVENACHDRLFVCSPPPPP
jgi:hypothetical protein